MEVIADVDGEEEKEEIEVMVNNMSKEMKRDLEICQGLYFTITRNLETLLMNEGARRMRKFKWLRLRMRTSNNYSLLMEIIEALKVSVLAEINKQKMNEEIWYLGNRAKNYKTYDHHLFQELKEVDVGYFRNMMNMR